jgi:ParB-like chromosome segregation protein Spo0J
MRDHPISNVQWINREKLTPNDYNPNHVAKYELKLLKTSLLSNGWLFPIIVSSELIEDKHPIIDGYHRWLISDDTDIKLMLGTLVPIVVLDISREQRILTTVQMNRAKGEHEIYKMHNLVKELLATYTEKQVMIYLGMEKEELLRMKSLLLATERSDNLSFSIPPILAE